MCLSKAVKAFIISLECNVLSCKAYAFRKSVFMISNLLLNDILIDQSRGFVHIVLNRPAALNAITLEMTRVLSIAIEKSARELDVKGVFISGEGDRAFCAGGDLKSLYKSGMAYRRGEAKENLARIFFEEEYNLNSQIKRFEKLYIAFLNGITMGGGYGISGHGSHVVATEKTLFAMPEVKIGFFVDIGASYNLVRCPHHIGLYLMLTGATISGHDMHFAGLAEAVIESDSINRMKARIAEAVAGDDGAGIDGQKKIVSDLLAKKHIQSTDKVFLEAHAERIDYCFGADSLYQILARVREDKSEWGQKTLAELEYACPFSLAVAFEQYKRVQSLDFGEVIAQDYVLATHFIQGHDLYDGIKATVIDKGQTPQWFPAKLEDVSQEEVANYFLPVNLL